MTDQLNGDGAVNAQATALRGNADFIIKKILLTSYQGSQYDITMMRRHLYIHEDIFENIISGHISLTDTWDLPMLLPIVGEETLTIVFTRPKSDDATGDNVPDEELPDYSATYRVYKMSERKRDGDRKQTYKLHFVSPEYITALKTKINRVFTETSYADMVKKIWNDTIKSPKPLFTEQTKFGHNLAIPNMPPYQLFNLLANRATAQQDSNGAFFVFYEDAKQYNFRSIGSLLSVEPAEEYFYQVMNALQDTGSGGYFPQTASPNLRAIEDMSFSGDFDIVNNLARGMYASRLYTIDIIRQRHEIIDFDYKDKFDKFPHVEKFRPNTDTLDALGAPQTLFKTILTNKDWDKDPTISAYEPGIKPWHLEEVIQHRLSYLEQIGHNRIAVMVSGDPRRKVGDVVKFHLPSAMGNVSAEELLQLDSYLQGKFLVVALKHEISPNSYYMKMELVKDSFFSKIQHVDPFPIYDPTY